jgi:hypothetical protein
MLVQLRHASLPPPLGIIAVHLWFTVADPRSGRYDRWEVWQTPNAGGMSCGHLHCNLQAPDGGVGGGATRIGAEWTGEDALNICSVLSRAAEEYPYRDHYCAWPGPNSNTFAAWVLRRAGVTFHVPWRAHGKNYAK